MAGELKRVSNDPISNAYARRRQAADDAVAAYKAPTKGNLANTSIFPVKPIQLNATDTKLIESEMIKLMDADIRNAKTEEERNKLIARKNEYIFRKRFADYLSNSNNQEEFLSKISKLPPAEQNAYIDAYNKRLNAKLFGMVKANIVNDSNRPLDSVSNSDRSTDSE